MSFCRFTFSTGTNGGVSVAGTLASALGGAVVGVAFYISTALCVHSDLLLRSAPQLPVILVCSIAGLVGSTIDSLLGATVQYSGLCRYDLLCRLRKFSRRDQ